MGLSGTTLPRSRTVVSARMLLAALVGLAAAGGASSCGGGDDAGFADRMAEEHREDRPVPAAAAHATTGGEIETTDVVYATVDGVPIRGYLARPAGTAPAPGVIVIQEWWGLNDNIRAMARTLAGEGYAALAVDLYRGAVAEDPESARRLVSEAMERESAIEDNLRQAWSYLAERQGAARIGVVGWCFGGGWSLRTALLLPEGIEAAVVYYGMLITDPTRLADLRAPLLGIFGAEDRGIPLESVREFEAALKRLDKPATIHVYDGAGHAFANPSGTRYDAVAAEDAWHKTIEFLADRLKP